MHSMKLFPGHIHLRDIAQAVKLGVAAAGGTPVEFPAASVFVMGLPPDMME